MNLATLKTAFDPKRISWRVGSTTQDKKKGMALAYLDSRDVQDRLDDVCGPEGWQCRYALLGKTTVCEIGIKVGEEWVWKADGAGDTDFEAEKGALSDSFKRAAVKWGIGRYLYDVDAPWVKIEAFGKSFKIDPSEFGRLEAVLGGKPSSRPQGATGTAAAPPTETKAPQTSAPVSDPPKPVLTEHEKGLEAIKWGTIALDTLLAFDRAKDAKGFDAWYPKAKLTIAKIEQYDPKLHAQLGAAVDMCLETLCPVK